MYQNKNIPPPVIFNPLKHHLSFIKEYAGLFMSEQKFDIQSLLRELKHIGNSVMDVYTGDLTLENISSEIIDFIGSQGINHEQHFFEWTEKGYAGTRKIDLTDGSQWLLKYKKDKERFVHIFPARNSPHTFRVKSNTLKSVLIYLIMIGKDLVTIDDINRSRAMMSLSPVKEDADIEAIIEMTEIIRNEKTTHPGSGIQKE